MECTNLFTAYKLPGGGWSFSKDSRQEQLQQVAVRCGRCIGCRVTRAEAWADRCEHEAGLHQFSCFVTLTYRDEEYPESEAVARRHAQLFFKRLRKAIAPARVRFFGCGEHGEATRRWHLHFCLFGFMPPDLVSFGKSRGGARMYQSEFLAGVWGHGLVTVQELNRKAAAYAARYACKDTSDGAVVHVRSDGVMCSIPATMRFNSNRPGIGAGFVERHADQLFATSLRGRAGERRALPRYYSKLLKRIDPARHAERAAEAELHAQTDWSEHTEERQQAKRIVQAAGLAVKRREGV